MHEDEIALARNRKRALVSAVEVITMEHDFCAEIRHGIHFDLRRRLRHDDHRGHAALARRECHALRMVACGGADDAAAGRALGQMRNLVVGAAQLEGKDCLQIFALQEDAVVEPARKARGFLER
jgi:hypothetical protein